MSALPDPAAQIRRIAEAVAIGCGRIRIVDATDDAASLDIEAEQPAVATLSRYLYACHYAFDSDLAGLAPGSRSISALPRGDPDFLGKLEAANPADTYVAPGWRVVARDAEGLAVERAGLRLQIDPDRHLPPEMRLARPGDLVGVRFPAWSPGRFSGYCFAHSAAGPVSAPTVARLYLHLCPEAAVEVWGSLLRRLHRLKLPYSFKILSDPRRFSRRDSAVLYIRRGDFDAVVHALSAVRLEAGSGFRPGVPTFTLPLGDGIAVADEPVDGLHGRSFGQSRMDLVADALCRLAGAGDAAGPQEVVKAIRAAFDAAGIDPDRPHLRDRDAPDYPASQLNSVPA